MRSKDYLRQINHIDKMIENKLREVERWKAIATGTNTFSESERVQSSGNKQRMEEAVCRYIQMEEEVNADIDRLVDIKQEVIKTIEELKKRGMWFVCADMGGDTMYDLNLTGSIGLVIGNEGDGVSRLVKEACDYVASIPMKGDIDSLNASVAAGVLGFEIVRQRMNASKK